MTRIKEQLASKRPWADRIQEPGPDARDLDGMPQAHAGTPDTLATRWAEEDAA